MNARGFAVGSILFALGACATERPTAVRQPVPPAFEISDAAHEGGTPGFYFLPPMVRQPAFTGTFDADITTLNPQIAICDITAGRDTDCGGSSSGATPAVAVFTTTSTPAVTVDTATPQYQVNWDTKAAGFVVGDTYRVHVRAGATGFRRELGFADILLTTTPGQVKHLATDSLIALQDGRTLPIHFRIETAVVGSVFVTAATARVALAGTDLVTGTVRDLHGVSLVGAAVTWTMVTAPAAGVAASLAPSSGPTDNTGSTSTTLLTTASSPGMATVTATAEALSADVSIVVQGTWAQVSAGGFFTCGLSGSGLAYCWGTDGNGELGDGGSSSSQASPVAVAGGLTFVQVVAGDSRACGLTSTGQAYCWGYNDDGAVGDGSRTARRVPTAVSGGLLFTSLAGGGDQACGIVAGGKAYCWGRGTEGQLGDGSAQYQLTPVEVAGGISFTQMTGGERHTCGLAGSGITYCWGEDIVGQLGDGSLQQEDTPVPVSGDLRFIEIVGGAYNTCGLTDGGQTYCWGTSGAPPIQPGGSGNVTGELGDGDTGVRSTPAPVAASVAFEQIAALKFGACGVTRDGSATCWGFDEHGQLGDSSTSNALSPVEVRTPLRFSQLSGGTQHTCGITTTGDLYCWGENNAGQLGNGTMTSSLAPVLVTPPK